MAFSKGFFLFALVCSARCNPLGQTASEATVCESTPNVLSNLGLGLGPLGLNLPPSLALQLLSQTVMPSMGGTTVCDSKSSFGLPVLSPYGSQFALPLNTGTPAQATVCESASNVSPMSLPYNLNLPTGYSLNGLNLPGGLVNGLNLPGGLVNGLSLPGGLVNGLSLPGGLVNGLSLPGGLANGLSLPSSTTVFETTSSNAIPPVSLPLGLSGLGLSGVNLPYPIQLGGLGVPLSGLGLPLSGLNLPLNGLSLPVNGLGLPLNGLTGLTVGSLGLPIM